MIIVMDSLRDTISKNFNRFVEMNPDITVPEIAAASGVTRGMVYKWIDKTNIPEPEKIEKLADLFRVRTLDFYRREGEDVPTIQPSRALKKYLVIPDNIVEGLCHFGPEHEIWEWIEAQIDSFNGREKQKNRPNHSS